MAEGGGAPDLGTYVEHAKLGRKRPLRVARSASLAGRRRQAVASRPAVPGRPGSYTSVGVPASPRTGAPWPTARERRHSGGGTPSATLHLGWPLISLQVDRFAGHHRRGSIPAIPDFRARERMYQSYCATSCAHCQFAYNTAPGDALRQRGISGKQKASHARKRLGTTSLQRWILRLVLRKYRVRGATSRKQRRVHSG